MKKKPELEDEEQDLQVIKAVAQAWHCHSNSSKYTAEFDAHRQKFKNKPSRFKLEAMKKLSGMENGGSNWDFGQSLWDSYEIVTISKRLEAALVLDHPFPESGYVPIRLSKKGRESKHSLRSLFNLTSRRFDEADIPRDDG